MLIAIFGQKLLLFRHGLRKEADLNLLAEHVEKEVRRIADATLGKLKEMDPKLATQLNPQITVKKWDSLFNVSITGDEDIPINKRGSGVKRLVLLNFFRAKAEQLAKDNPSAPVIYAIEEPETSQHPHNQRMLINALTDLATDNQVIITTHTPMLAKIIPDSSLRYIHETDDKKREVLEGGGDTNNLLVKSLGVLPDNSIKLFIGVEGKYDIVFLKNMSKALKNEDGVLDLDKMEMEGELIFFPLGGSSLALWTSRLEPLSRPEFHLFDCDTPPPADPKYKVQADEINQRDRCKAMITGKAEMENYIHFQAINDTYQQFEITLGLGANFNDFDDVPYKVAELVHNVSGSPNSWKI